MWARAWGTRQAASNPGCALLPLPSKLWAGERLRLGGGSPSSIKCTQTITQVPIAAA